MLNSSAAIIQRQYQTLMTIYSNCGSSLKNALITGLWFYIVSFIFLILLFNIYINKYTYDRPPLSSLNSYSPFVPLSCAFQHPDNARRELGQPAASQRCSELALFRHTQPPPRHGAPRAAPKGWGCRATLPRARGRDPGGPRSSESTGSQQGPSATPCRQAPES